MLGGDAPSSKDQLTAPTGECASCASGLMSGASHHGGPKTQYRAGVGWTSRTVAVHDTVPFPAGPRMKMSLVHGKFPCRSLKELVAGGGLKVVPGGCPPAACVQIIDVTVS